MAKDIIYIEANDDITAVINKIKDSKQKIVALVPPKQIGILQSAVNLELIARSAKNVQKIIVIVTNNQALIRLAGLTRIPVAKSFKSKPELVDLPAIKVDNDDDIIDGAELPIAEFAGVKTDGQKESEQQKTDLKPTKIKVPNYNKFRKGLFLFILMVLLVGGFLVWAIIFAPQAEITIKTNTKTTPVSQTVQLVDDSSKQAIDKNLLLAQSQVLTKRKVVEFAATGEKEVGNPASGKITLSRSLGGSVPVKAGSGFSKGGCTFVSQQDVTVPAASVEVGGSNIIPGQVEINVVATKIGEQCNIEAGSFTSSIDGISAQGTNMTGGSKKTIKVVTDQDLSQAKKAFNKLSEDDYLKELRNKFDSSIVIIEESLDKQQGDLIAPSAGQEAAQGKSKLEQDVKYTLYGVAKKDLLKLVEFNALKENKNARVYQSDEQKVSFIDYVVANNQAKVRIVTKAVVGPLLDKEQVKQFAANKVTGQIKDKYEAIEGVTKVKVDYYPFWVRTVPKEIDRIKVEIELVK